MKKIVSVVLALALLIISAAAFASPIASPTLAEKTKVVESTVESGDASGLLVVVASGDAP